jgi:hypothetical protein
MGTGSETLVVDLDVVDSAEGRVHQFAVPSGLSATTLHNAIGRIASRVPAGRL